MEPRWESLDTLRCRAEAVLWGQPNHDTTPDGHSGESIISQVEEEEEPSARATRQP